MNEFSTAVITAIRGIPRGKIATYKQIAALCGKPHAGRAVAWILKSCSEKYELPWHRVLNASGKISFKLRSHSFRLQCAKLRAERVAVSPGGTVELEKFQWRKRPRRVKSRRLPKMFS